MPDPRLLLNNSGRQVPSVQRPIDNKIVRGSISQVSAKGVFAVIPDYSHTYQFGPLEVVYSRGSTAPSVKDECLVAFDSNNIGYLLWFEATPTFAISSWGYCLADGTIEESSEDFTVVKSLTAKYEVKWTTPKANSHYAVVAMAGASGSGGGSGKPVVVNFLEKTTTAFVFELWNLKEEPTSHNFNFMVKNH